MASGNLFEILEILGNNVAEVGFEDWFCSRSADAVAVAAHAGADAAAYRRTDRPDRPADGGPRRGREAVSSWLCYP